MSPKQTYTPIFTILSSLLWFSAITIDIYLFLLKVNPNAPCIGEGGCHGIIHSSYGSLLGIPVSLFSLAILLLLPLTGRFLQKSILTIMVLGGITFLLVQAFILHSFCIWCNTHHALILLLAIIPVAIPIKAYNSLFLIIPASLFISSLLLKTPEISSHKANPQLNTSSDSSNTSTNQHIFTQEELSLRFSWDKSDNLTPESLILSWTCPSCLEKLSSLHSYLLSNPAINTSNLPPTLFYTNPANIETSTLILACLLSAQDFKDFWESLKPAKDFILVNNPTYLKSGLLDLFPNYKSYMTEAEEILQEHDSILSTHNLQITPLYIKNNEELIQNFSLSSLLK